MSIVSDLSDKFDSLLIFVNISFERFDLIFTLFRKYLIKRLDVNNLKGGIRSSIPIVSVMKPGTSRNAPMNKSIRPETISVAGARPCVTDSWISLNVCKP